MARVAYSAKITRNETEVHEMPIKTLLVKDAIRIATGELVEVLYIDSHPAEGARYEILNDNVTLGYGEVIFAHELSFDPFAIFTVRL